MIDLVKYINLTKKEKYFLCFLCNCLVFCKTVNRKLTPGSFSGSLWLRPWWWNVGKLFTDVRWSQLFKWIIWTHSLLFSIIWIRLKLFLYSGWIPICCRKLQFNRSTSNFSVTWFYAGTDNRSVSTTQWQNHVLFEFQIGACWSISQKRRKRVRIFP